MVNKLSNENRNLILNMPVERSSMRAISRVAEVSVNTVTRVLVNAGDACQEFHDKYVHGLWSKRVQADEIWSFCYAKKQDHPEKRVKDPHGYGWQRMDVDGPGH